VAGTTGPRSSDQEKTMGLILLWLIGIPIPIIILLALLAR
jgi:hypothetical protein